MTKEPVVFVIGPAGSGKRECVVALKEVYSKAQVYSIRKLQRDFFIEVEGKKPESTKDVNEFARYHQIEFKKYREKTWKEMLADFVPIIFSFSSTTESSRAWYIRTVKETYRPMIAVALTIDEHTLRLRLEKEKYPEKFINDTLLNLHQYDMPSYADGFDEIHIIDMKGKV